MSPAVSPAALGAALVALAAGAVAYVFVLPLLSGERRAEKRQRALVGAGAARAARGDARAGVNRRDQVAQTLKDIDDKESRKKARVRLEVQLVRAGLTWSKRQFYLVSAGLGLAVGLALLVVTGAPVAALAGAFAGGFGLPRWLMRFLQKRRIARFGLELPNAIDVIVRGIRSGLPVGDCLRIIAREAGEPVRGEFKAIVEAQALGISISDACARLYERMPVAEANFFAIVIGIQAKSGGNLSEALGNLSRVLRERRKMRAKIQAMSMEAKASAAIIAALPFIVATLTYITSPNYIELLWSCQAGYITLIASGLWMSMGVLVMRGMINFEV